MIFSTIHTNDCVSSYPKAIQTAINYLKSNDFTKMETGAYEIEGKDIYAQVMDATTKPFAETRAEFHKKYIDVQFLVSGEERLGFAPDTGSFELEEGNDDRDIYFYKSVTNEGFIDATPGCYSIFFPWDVHRPALQINQPTAIRKVVVKVNVALL